MKRKGIRILTEKGITIITPDDIHTVGTTEIHAFEDRVRPHVIEAVVEELAISPFYLRGVVQLFILENI